MIFNTTIPRKSFHFIRIQMVSQLSYHLSMQINSFYHKELTDSFLQPAETRTARHFGPQSLPLALVTPPNCRILDFKAQYIFYQLIQLY